MNLLHWELPTYDVSSIVLKNGIIQNRNEFVYLGLAITDSSNITNDLRLEIKQRAKNFNKFFAFLSHNKYAPLEVKEKVLQSCVVLAILHNCESC